MIHTKSINTYISFSPNLLMCTSYKRSRLSKLFHGLLTLTLTVASVAPTLTVANWDPTLLVNTESFVEIDGDGSTDIELRFGGATNRLYLMTLQLVQK